MAGRFLWARFARIWPGYIVALLLYLLLVPPTPADWAAGTFYQVIAANVAMVHTWIPFRHFYRSFNGPAWSISTEFGFYLAFPLLLAWSGRGRQWRAALMLLLAFLMVIGLVTYCNLAGVPSEASDPTWATGAALANSHRLCYDALIYFHPAGRIFEFVLGMCACLVFKNWSPRYRAGRTTGTIVEAGAIALVVVTMYLSESAAKRFEAINWVGEPGALWLRAGGVPAFAFALLILVMASGRGVVARLLSWRLFIILGEVSYGIYLLHWGPLHYYAAHRAAFDLFPDWLTYSVFWAFVLLLAHLVWSVVEKPMRQWLVGLWPAHVVARHPSSDKLFLLPGWRRERLRAGAGDQPAKPGLSRRVPAFQRIPLKILVIAAEGLAVVFLAGVAVYAARELPTIHRVTVAEAMSDAAAQDARPELAQARFDDKFTLCSVRSHWETESLKVELIWRSRTRQRLCYITGVHFLDESGNLYDGADFPQDLNQSEVESGALWRDTLDIPRPRLSKATSIGLCIYQQEPRYLMSVDRGPRDLGDRRLLLRLTPLPRPQVQGTLDRVNAQAIQGWAYDAGNPDKQLAIEVSADGIPVGTVVADQLRQDLAVAGLGDGRHGFSIPTPARLLDGKEHSVSAKPAGAGSELNQSPMLLFAHKP